MEKRTLSMYLSGKQPWIAPWFQLNQFTSFSWLCGVYCVCYIYLLHIDLCPKVMDVLKLK